MAFLQEKFVRPDFCHKDVMEKIRLASQNRIYTYTFPTVYCWAEKEDYTLCLTDDAFLIKCGVRGENAYLAPCGADESKKQLVEALLEETAPVFYFLGEDDVTFLEKTFPGRFTFEECRDDTCYLYDRIEQENLRGEKFKHIRHKIHQSERAYSWTIEPITEDAVDRAVTINRIWAKRKGLDDSDVLPADKALQSFRDLQMWGLIFQADGQDAAYMLGSFVSPEIFDTNFNKTLLPDIDYFVRWKIFQNLPEGVCTLDSEEDMGIAGLREHKMRRVPSCFRTVWKGYVPHE